MNLILQLLKVKILAGINVKLMKIMHSLKKMYQAMNNKKIAIGDYKTKSRGIPRY
jgi:hypothetical protein